MLRDSTKRVITAVYDPSNPLLPEERSIRLENWTKHPCTVIKHTKKLRAFSDHFFTNSRAQKSKKRGITEFLTPQIPQTPFHPSKWSVRLGNGTRHSCMVLKHTNKIWTFQDHFFTYLKFYVYFQRNRNQDRKSDFLFRYFYAEECPFTFFLQVIWTIFIFCRFGPFCCRRVTYIK